MLDANGWDVRREYYYNDAGVQIENLALSVQARAKGLKPDDAGWPEDGYRGDYIDDVAEAYLTGDTVESDGHGVAGARDATTSMRSAASPWPALRREQNGDLAAFGVVLRHAISSNPRCTPTARSRRPCANSIAHGHTYEEGGALWLRTTDFGDDKDRVMRKSDGSYTYFVPDMAYHLSKWQRGYTRAITELGADHHGSLARVKAGLQALDAGIPQGYPEYVLHQMVTVMRGGEEVKLSKRAGSYLTLRDLIDEAGRDATRWFLIARKPDSQLTFDIDLARAEQRQSGLLRAVRACARLQRAGQAVEKGCRYDRDNGEAKLALLDDEHSLMLMVELSRYPEVVETAGQRWSRT